MKFRLTAPGAAMMTVPKKKAATKVVTFMLATLLLVDD
jgi:serine protease inhibitor ecotin